MISNFTIFTWACYWSVLLSGTAACREYDAPIFGSTTFVFETSTAYGTWSCIPFCRRCRTAIAHAKGMLISRAPKTICRLSMGCHTLWPAPVLVQISFPKPGYEAKPSSQGLGYRDPYEYRGRWHDLGKTMNLYYSRGSWKSLWCPLLAFCLKGVWWLAA